MPKERLLISGDIAFNVKILPVLDHTDVKGWTQTWDKVEALKPKIIIPGHGGVTDLNIDQTQFRQFKTYNELHRQNADRLFQVMEFEE